jgi:hypothetical protein
MKTIGKAIFFILIITLLGQLVLPVFFVQQTQSSIVSADSNGHHQVVITADVCSKRLTGSISASFFPIRPVLSTLIILVVSIFSINESKLFLPITTQKPFHPPRAW